MRSGVHARWSSSGTSRRPASRLTSETNCTRSGKVMDHCAVVIAECWVVNIEAQTVEVFHLVDGQYRLLGRWRPSEIAASRLLEGFTVPVAELFGAM